MRKGSRQSAEAKKKISLGMRGKPKSLETKEKMSNARTVYWANKRQEMRHRRRLMEEMARPLHVEHDEATSVTETYPIKRTEFR